MNLREAMDIIDGHTRGGREDARIWAPRLGLDPDQLVAQGYLAPWAVSPLAGEAQKQAPSDDEMIAARDDAVVDQETLLAAMYGRKDPKDDKIAYEIERSKAQSERERVALEADRIAAQREHVSLLRDLAKLAQEQKAAAAQDDVAESIDVPTGVVPPVDAYAGLPPGVGRRAVVKRRP